MDTEELATEPTMTSAASRWFVGVIAALVLSVYGVHCLFAGEALMPAQRTWITLQGAPALALGFCYISLGVFIHIHWFWTSHPRLCHHAGMAKLITLIALLTSLGFTIYHLALA